jgi:hypothetical protein
VVVSFIGGETGVAGLPRQNHRLPKSQWQSLPHLDFSNTHFHGWELNSQLGLLAFIATLSNYSALSWLPGLQGEESLAR